MGREGGGFKAQVPALCSDIQEGLELVLWKPLELLALSREVRVPGYLWPFPTSQPSLAATPHETHRPQLGAGEDFAFVTALDGAALCGVTGLQGESAEPTAGTSFNLLVVTALKTKQLKRGFLKVICFAFSAFQGLVPSSVTAGLFPKTQLNRD